MRFMFMKKSTKQTNTKLELQRFDTNIFDVNFYRLSNINLVDLKDCLNRISSEKKYIIDTKIDSTEIDVSYDLLSLGFHKICNQIEFVFNPKNKIDGIRSKIDIKRDINESLATELAKNFVYDRFSQDPRISKTKKNIFYKEWIINTFKSDEIYLACLDEDFCSFKIFKNEIIIDLLSVINKRKGNASDLLCSINNYAVLHNFKTIKVVTEVENLPAIKTYLKNGYSFNKFISCFHFVKT